MRITAPATVPADWTLEVETAGGESRLYATHASPCGGRLVLIVAGLRPVATGCGAETGLRLTAGPAGVTLEIQAEALLDATAAVGACQQLLSALELTTWTAGRVHASRRTTRDHRPRRLVERR